MPGLRLVRAAAVGCALVLAAAVVASAAQVPQRLLYGLLQLLAVLALVAPYLAVAGPGATCLGLRALPEAPGVTGVRGFCVDESGAIYVIPEERLPTVAQGRCPAGEPLR